MARKKLSMRQLHEILRLKYQNQLSIREIARSCGLPTSKVDDYLQRAEIARISWPPPEGLSEPQLVERLMATQPLESEPGQVLPDWPHIQSRGICITVSSHDQLVSGFAESPSPASLIP